MRASIFESLEDLKEFLQQQDINIEDIVSQVLIDKPVIIVYYQDAKDIKPIYFNHPQTTLLG